jgi:hypothetical protein
VDRKLTKECVASLKGQIDKLLKPLFKAFLPLGVAHALYTMIYWVVIEDVDWGRCKNHGFSLSKDAAVACCPQYPTSTTWYMLRLLCQTVGT